MPRSSASVPPVLGAPPAALFEILMREHADALTAFLRASVREASTVEDLFQETMLTAWRRLGDYDRERPFGPWLRGIARNLILAHYRQRSREIPFASEEVLEILDRHLAQIERQPGDTFDERIAAVRDCVERLDPLYRDPVTRHYSEGLSTDAIAECLASTRDAVQKRLQRARLLIAACLRRKSVLGGNADVA